MPPFTVHFEEDICGMRSASERRLFAEELRRNPGQVALLAVIKNQNVARQYSYCVRRAKDNMQMFTPAGDFEASSVTMFGATRIYVRYTGDRP